MIYCFGNFQLDQPAAELRHADGRVIPLERQVYLLLSLLVKNGERITTHDEIIDAIWHGADISDAAIASRVRSARAAIGDSGVLQNAVQTVRGRGFRFILPVTTRADASLTAATTANEGVAPSIAVLPFEAYGELDQARVFAPALAHELIVSLSLTKWLTVIARASSFQLLGLSNAQLMSEQLDVSYVLSGAVEITGSNLVVSPILTSTNTGEVIWAERYTGPIDDIFQIKADVTNSVVAAVEFQVPRHQASLALRQEIDSLDAWSFFHLGLNHIYRFTEKDNALSAQYFEEALARAPDFARAHAGLSFVAFQRAFTGFGSNRAAAARDALSAAEKAMEQAPDDPFSNFVLGRSHWVLQDLDTAAHYLRRAVTLNPNYAQGHYSLGLVQALNGAVDHIDRRADLATRLSPLDPLLYGMHGMKAWVRFNRYEWAEAAYWADLSARTPGAHFLIDMLAAMTHQASGNTKDGHTFAARARAPPGRQIERFFIGVSATSRTSKKYREYSPCQARFLTRLCKNFISMKQIELH
ncbi:winged helix-turn-helix domain-containing protein [Neptunicoccus cionae]|uniref:Membrane protein n=1 Tax=Neptunicoccus cionae TaxID=2035344 RepID=A0A916R215_9RHOB|nr:winged helix-turn-helix domain-containing protein [Amylibacter cionae]GGA28856.1 membrane protein [Amylibacter cionae]